MPIYALNSCTVKALLNENSYISCNLQEKLSQCCRICIPPTVYYDINLHLILQNDTNKLKKFGLLYNDCYIPKVIEQQYMQKCAETSAFFVKKQISGVDTFEIFTASWCLLTGAILVAQIPDNFDWTFGLIGLKCESWDRNF
jgi:hypothetical protein